MERISQAQPILTEPGVKYFLFETLKKCNEKRIHYTNLIFNILMLILFVVITWSILYYKKKNKLTEKEVQKRDIQNQQYILEKIKSIKEEEKKQKNMIITNLPKFESEHTHFFL